MGRRLHVREKGALRRPLDPIFSAPANLAVLRVFFRISGGATGHEIARLAGIHPPAAHGALSRLEALGIVRREFAGRSHVFTLNRSHFAVQRMIEPLLAAERTHREKLFGLLRRGLAKVATSGVVFGSRARGDEEPRSDLDVCLVVPAVRGKEAAVRAVHRLASPVREEFGMTLAPLVYAESEFVRRYRRGEALFRNIVADGETFLGRELKKVVLLASRP